MVFANSFIISCYLIVDWHAKGSPHALDVVLAERQAFNVLSLEGCSCHLEQCYSHQMILKVKIFE